MPAMFDLPPRRRAGVCPSPRNSPACETSRLAQRKTAPDEIVCATPGSLLIKSLRGHKHQRGTAMNQQTTVEPAVNDAMSSVQSLVHDGMTQMNSATKGIVHTVFDLSVQAMQQYQRLTEQNLEFCSDIQDALLKNAQQIRETNLKLWASTPIGEWFEPGRSTRN